MKRLPILLSFLFFIIISAAFLQLTSCSSPVKKGFQHLENKQLAEAEAKFKKAENHKTFGAAAQQGLLEVDFEKNKNPTIGELYTYKTRKETNQKAYKKAGYKTQSKIRKKGGFQVNNFREFNKKLQTKTFDLVKNADRVLALDSFLVAYPRPDFKIKKSVDTLIKHIFIGKIKASADYVEWAEKIQHKKLRPGLQLGAIDFVKKTNQLLVLDTFLQYFPLKTIKDSTAQANFKKLRYDLVEKALFSPSDYATLTSLFHNHQGVVSSILFSTGNASIMESLAHRVITAFLREHDFKEIRIFTEDHSQHFVTIDCWSDELTEKAEAEKTVGLLQFLIKNPFSINGRIVSNEIDQRHKNNTITKKEKEFWTTEEVAMFNSILVEHQLKRGIDSGDFSAAQISQLEKYLNSAAPALRSFRLMYDAVDFFWKKRDWSSVKRITKIAQPLFPDQQIDCNVLFALYKHKQDWFAVVVELMQRPTENIFPKKFEPASELFTYEHHPVMALNEKSFIHNELIRSDLGGTVFSQKERNNKWMRGKGALSPKPLSITQDGKHMLVKVGNKEINWIAKTEKGWEIYDKLPEHISKQFTQIGRASLSADGKILIFAASKDSINLYRWVDTDLYISRKTPSGNWGAVIPLKDLNSPNEEASPFLHADGKTLYFSSSDFKKTAGLIDVFVSRRLDDSWARWSEPVNLGKEINSMANDWGNQYHIGVTGNAYFEEVEMFGKDIATTRLPSFARPNPVDVITLLFDTNDETLPRMRVEVKEAGTSKIVYRLSNLPDNESSFIMPDSISVEVHVVSEATFPIVKKINPSNPSSSDLKEVSIPIVTIKSMLEENIPVPLQNGQFDYDKAEVKSILQSELTLIAEWLEKKPWIIEITGHTDNKGGEEYNQELSERRARSVRDYLLNKGIPIKRLKYKGLGATKPTASNDSETGRTMNRRIEIRLKKKELKKKKLKKK